MSAFVLVSGKLLRDPEQKLSGKGHNYATATIRDGSGGEGAFWRLTVFSVDARAELMALRAGDGLAATGAMKAELYTPAGGEPRVSLSMVADRVISARQRKREQTAERRDERKSAPRDSVHAPPGFADEIPF